MTKVKIRDFVIKTSESHLDYPIYLHYQDEDCHDEYLKVTEKGTISIKHTHFGIEITSNSTNTVNSNYINNISKEVYFKKQLKSALEYITRLSKSDS